MCAGIINLPRGLFSPITYPSRGTIGKKIAPPLRTFLFIVLIDRRDIGGRSKLPTTAQSQQAESQDTVLCDGSSSL